MLEKGGLPLPALPGPGGESPLKSTLQVDTSVWEVPSSIWTGEMANRSELAEGDLGPPPCLNQNLENFMGGCMPQQGTEGKRDSQWGLWPKPLEDHCSWIEWAWPMHWHAGLVAGVGGDPWYRGPPGTCLEGEGLLQGPYGKKPCPRWKKQLLSHQSLNILGRIGFCHPKTHRWVARTISCNNWQRLYYMLKLSNIGWRRQSHCPLASPANWLKVFWNWGRPWSHSHPLRIQRSLVTTLLHEARISGITIKPAPGYFSMAYGGRHPRSSISHTTQAPMPATPLGEHAMPINQPSTCLPKDNVSEPPLVAKPPAVLQVPLVKTEEAMRTEKAVRTEEPVKMEEAMEAEGGVKAEEVMALVTLVWTHVLLSRPAVPVGLVPPLDDEQHCHHSHSCCSQRRANLHAEKDQLRGDPTRDCPVPSGDSQSTGHFKPQVETSTEDAIVQPQVPPPRFADIASVLQRSHSP